MKTLDINAIVQKKELQLPSPNPYILPKYIEWTQEILTCIQIYGLFQHENIIYIIRKGPEATNEDTQEKYSTYLFDDVSNFSIKILQHMEDEKFPMRLVQIKNVKGRKRTFETSTDNFVSIGLFKKMVEGWGNFRFTGTPNDYEKLKTYLMDQMGDGRMITVLGWQPEGFFAFNNCAVNEQTIHYNEYGSFEHKGVQYYVPSANKIYRSNNTKYMNQKLVVHKQGVDFKTWCKQMTVVHRQHARISVSFAVACMFSDFIFEYHNFFPVLFLYGEASTGKSKMVEAIQLLFGKKQSPMQITGKANTDKAKIRKFAQFNNMLVFLEEFKNTVPQDIIEMLKGIWNRYGYERGNIDSAYGTETVPISSGAIITGNDYPNDDPLLTRLIVDEMMKDKFTMDEKLEFGKLEEMMNAGYSNIVQEIVKHRKYFEENYVKTYNDIKKEISMMFFGISGIDGRMIDNIAVLVAVHRVMASKIDFSFGEGELKDTLKLAMERQNNKRDSGGEVAKFWDVFIGLFKKGIININDEFEMSGENLFVYFNRIHNSYYQEHFQIYRSVGLNKSTMQQKLEKHPAFKEKKSSHRIGNNNTSAMVFNLKLLSQDVRNTLISIAIDRNPGNVSKIDKSIRDEIDNT